MYSHLHTRLYSSRQSSVHSMSSINTATCCNTMSMTTRVRCSQLKIFYTVRYFPLTIYCNRCHTLSRVWSLFWSTWFYIIYKELIFVCYYITISRHWFSILNFGYVSIVQISFIASDQLRSWLFGITFFGSFRFLTLACKNLWWGFIIRN